MDTESTYSYEIDAADFLRAMKRRTTAIVARMVTVITAP